MTLQTPVKFRLPEIIRKDGWLNTEANAEAMARAFKRFKFLRGPDFGDPRRQDGRCLGHTRADGTFVEAR